MTPANLDQLQTWDPNSGALNVVIETPKNSRNKFRYEPETASFALSKILPRGLAFPFDFGFVPSTLAEDGDALDVLVLMDEPAFAGCRIPCRLLGVIEGQQKDDGKIERNDRLLAVAEGSHEHRNIQSIRDLNEHMLEEIEHFFVCYHDLDGKKFRVLGVHGTGKAVKLVRLAAKRFRKESKQQEKIARNGRLASHANP